MLNMLTIRGTDCTLAKREIIYCIEQIGLTHAIATDEAIYLRRHIELCCRNAPIIYYGEIIH